MPELQITDSISGGQGGMSGYGSVASRLLASGFNVNALRTQATLRKDEWKLYDTAILEIARSRLVGVGDLMSKGLRFPLANALGITRVEWETVSDMDPAAITMSGISESKNDRLEFNLLSLPVPIIHRDFNLNIRALEASRRTGQPLDTAQASVAGRKVAEAIETMLFSGATVLGTNNAIYGYRTAPNRNTGSLTASWATATGDQIVGDILRMIQALVNDNMYGPYQIYVGANAFVHFGDDYKAGSDKTIMQRVMEIPNISGIKATKDLASTEALLIQMSSDVVDMIDGLQPTTVQWESHGGMVIHFKVMSIMVPRVRNDYLLQSGIAHYAYP